MFSNAAAFSASPSVASSLINKATNFSLSSSTFAPRPVAVVSPNKSRCARPVGPRFEAETGNRSTPGVVNPPCMLSFSKYHGLGNDFVLIDNRDDDAPVLTPAQSIEVCDRHTGVGADGVIFLLPPSDPTYDFSMRLYNSDGSEPEMCGNGIRCLGRFASDLGVRPLVPNKYTVHTLGGPMVLELLPNSDVKVDMGAPITTSSEAIPTKLNVPTDTLRNVADRDWTMCCVSMGNPHAITFIDDDQLFHQLDRDLEVVGPKFEHHPAFPHRTNTEFIRMISPTECDMLVWERGAGRTRACGTGACAVVVAAVLTGRAKKDTEVVVHLPGGDLTIEWSSTTGNVFMTGPAELVFAGKLSKLESRPKSPALA